MADLYEMTWNDPLYPKCLQEIHRPPKVLWIKGDPHYLSCPQIAIVGSRLATPAGLAIAKEFAEQLALAGFIVTSGLAEGIDGAAHAGALSAQKPTIAVLGSGLNHIYPRQHSALAQSIAVQGALVSEFPANAPPRAAHFPQRNRIISGLSLGTLVVEANLKSGSLITARLANEQGREVFAIPGSIRNAQSAGCHALIQQGAKLVENVAQILEELAWQNPVEIQTVHKPMVLELDQSQHKLLECVGFSPTSVDSIVLHSGFSLAIVLPGLVELELHGYIQSVSIGYLRVR